MKNQRIIIVGGPRRGKSTLARELRHVAGNPQGYAKPCPVRCGDPLSKVKEPLTDVEYLPEGIPISGDGGAAQWVADNWFTLPGPWVCEGWVMARALRRWVAGANLADYGRDGRLRCPMPADRIIVLDHPAFTEELKGQANMHRAVMTVWSQIAHHFTPIAEYR